MIYSISVASHGGRTIWINNLSAGDAQYIAQALSDSTLYANRPVDVWNGGERVQTFVNGESGEDYFAGLLDAVDYGFTDFRGVPAGLND